MLAEIDPRLTLLQQVRKKSICAEVGVFKGRFSEAILNVCRPKELYLIDPWENNPDPTLSKSLYSAGSKHDMPQIHMDVVNRFKKQIAAGQVKIQRGASKSVLTSHPPDSLDFVYIDGDHRFEAVSNDIEIASSRVRVGGLIGLDDCSTGKWWGSDVIRAVNLFLGQNASAFQVVFALGNQVLLKRLA